MVNVHETQKRACARVGASKNSRSLTRIDTRNDRSEHRKGRCSAMLPIRGGDHYIGGLSF
jgi:hypothetical protein